MIKINLAPSAQGKNTTAGAAFGEAAADASEIQKQGAIRLLVLLIIPLAIYAYELQLIPGLQGKLNSKRNVLTSLKQKNDQAKGAVEEIKKFKEDQAKLQKQIDTLEGLRKERLKEVKILDNLQKDIPDKVWLTKIDFQESKLSLSGLATADVELTGFMENLSRSVFLHEVNLVRSSEQPSENGTLKRFDISCAVDQLSPSQSNEVKR